MTSIPEDHVLDEDIKVIRPLNEVKMDQINYHQIIRNFCRPKPPPKAVDQNPSALQVVSEQGGRGILT